MGDQVENVDFETDPVPRRERWKRPLVYLVAIPTAVLLLERVSHLLPLGELLTRAARVWRAVTHDFWSWCFSWLHVHVQPGIADLLTLSALFLGAAFSLPVDVEYSERTYRKNVILAIGSGLSVMVLFAFPYFSEWTVSYALSLSMAVAANLVTGIYNRYKPERWIGLLHYPTVGVLWWCAYMILIMTIFQAPSDHKPSNFIEQWVLPFGAIGLFGLGLNLLADRNPLALTRVVVVIVALYVADRIATWVAPMWPEIEAWIASVETRAVAD